MDKSKIYLSINKSIIKPSFPIIYLLIIPTLCLTMSCRKVQTYPSKANILNRSSDLTLKDSSLIFGMIYSAVDEKTPEMHAKVWIENSTIMTYSDNSGFYRIKLIPGTYTIKCLGQFSNQDMTIVVNNLSIVKNKKIEINFFQGVTIE